VKVPPLRLPARSMFCPDCLRLRPVEQVTELRFDLPCLGNRSSPHAPPCHSPVSFYSDDGELYERRRAQLMALSVSVSDYMARMQSPSGRADAKTAGKPRYTAPRPDLHP
jgi:hypothetical protein